MLQWHRRAGLFALFLSSLTLGAQAAPGVDPFNVFAGTWKVTSESFLTPYSKPASVLLTLHTACSRAGGAYTCRQGGDNASGPVATFTYDVIKKTFTRQPLPILANPSTGQRLGIDGARWTFAWQEADNGNTVFFRLINDFQGPYDIAFRSEYSLDQTHWTIMSEGHESRIGP